MGPDKYALKANYPYPNINCSIEISCYNNPNIKFSLIATTYSYYCYDYNLHKLNYDQIV